MIMTGNYKRSLLPISVDTRREGLGLQIVALQRQLYVLPATNRV